MAIAEAEDFRAESDALHRLLVQLDDGDFARPTGFKGWTINDVLTHLYFWNQMARFQLTDEAKLIARMKAAMDAPAGFRAFEGGNCDDLAGRALLEAWHGDVQATADQYTGADPKRRLKWVGPDMSARSSITARLMETWAHGQAVYDELGVRRDDADRIRNIVVLGVNTYGWTFKNRKQVPPGEMPYLVLTAPSGAVWTYGAESETERIEGPATAFCQVVTQTRNIADVPLVVTGPAATAWMANAQCFAGPPNDPPPPGLRKIKEPA
ncbi:MAG: TIGR03084 family metal-binding protein [Pseudomonadota bacterium]